MPGIARVSLDTTGGIITGALVPNVLVNNSPIAVTGATVTPYGSDCKAAPVLGIGSQTVTAGGLPVCRLGDSDICGTPIAGGSGDVEAG